MNRRKFLVKIANLIFIIFSLTLFSSLFKKRDISLEELRQTVQYRIELEEIKRKKFLVIYIKNDPILLVQSNDKIQALLLRCPHRGCTLYLDRERKLISCPCHGSLFDLDGKRLRGPAPTDLRKIDYKIKDKFLYIYFT